MSAFFASASSQRLSNAGTTITAVPFTAGMWVYPTTTGTLRAFWSLGDTGAPASFWSLEQTALNAWQTNCSGSTANVGTVTANAWAFALYRAVSATNRRLDVLQSGGTTVSVQDVTNKIPTSIDTLSLGCRSVSTPDRFFDGNVAEFWITNTDIQPDGLALNTDLLRQLAYGGPFSLPHLEKDIVEYHSLRAHLSSDTFDNESDFLPILGETLTNVGAVTLGAHPPLPYWYVDTKDRPVPFVI